MSQFLRNVRRARGGCCAWGLRSATVALLLAVTACGGSFRSKAGGGSLAVLDREPFAIEFSFADGSQDLQLRENGLLPMRLEFPLEGFSNLFVGDTIDPDRLRLSTTPPLVPAISSRESESSLSAQLQEQGFLTVSEADQGVRQVAVDWPIDGPFEFPLGLVVLEAVAIDDLDRETEPVQVSVTIQALDRPTAVVRLEAPSQGPTPSGILLPTNDEGKFFIGEALPFILLIEGIPNLEGGAAFDQLVSGGSVDPDRLIVTADRDLGDPGNGGFLAGENLAPLFGQALPVLTDPDSGVVLVAALFEAGASQSPPLGDITFQAVLVDDSGASSASQSALLNVEPIHSFRAEVMPIFTSCAQGGFCHGEPNPSGELDLQFPEIAWQETVGVRSIQTPDNSCATQIIEPYQPSASYLLHKLLNTHRDGCVMGRGRSMPRGAPLLPGESVQAVTRWIQQGAQNN